MAVVTGDPDTFGSSGITANRPLCIDGEAAGPYVTGKGPIDNIIHVHQLIVCYPPRTCLWDEPEPAEVRDRCTSVRGLDPEPAFCRHCPRGVLHHNVIVSLFDPLST